MKKAMLASWLLSFFALIQQTITMQLITEKYSKIMPLEWFGFACMFALVMVLFVLVVLAYLGKFKKEEKSWIIVTKENKWTYIFLVLIPLSVCKIVFFDLHLGKQGVDHHQGLILSIMIMVISWYFFVRLNMYSGLMNPNHPCPLDDDKKV